jgi:hypothetical protein
MLTSPNLSLSFSSGNGGDNAVISTLADRIALVMEIVRSTTSPALEILVALSGLLSPQDYATLGPSMWNSFLLSDNAKLVAPVNVILIN